MSPSPECIPPWSGSNGAHIPHSRQPTSSTLNTLNCNGETQSLRTTTRSRSPLRPSAPPGQRPRSDLSYDPESGCASPTLIPSTRTPSPSVASVVSNSNSSIRSLQKYRVADFDLEDKVLPPPPSAALRDHRQTCYSPEPPDPIEEPTNSAGGGYAYRRSIVANAKTAFLDRYSKLPPLISRGNPSANNGFLPTPPASGPSSPAKSVGSFLSSSPTRANEPPASRASVAGVSRPQHAKHASRASLFGDLFNVNGTSAPLNIGILPTPQSPNLSRHTESDEYSDFEDEEEADEDEELGDEMDAYIPRPSVFTRPRRSDTIRSQTNTSPTAASKFSSWLSKAASYTTAKTAPSPTSSSSESAIASDPLLNLDIHTHLFPTGTPDPLSPNAFNDLFSAAEVLIMRIQTAYKAKLYALEDLRSEQSCQAEELNEAETRAEHLKIQLQSMAARATEQEREMEALRQELDRERAARRDDEQRRKRSVRRVHEGVEKAGDSWRHRAGTASDSGFESGDGDADVESENESSEEGSSPAAYNTPRVSRPASSVSLADRSSALLKRSNASRGKLPRPLSIALVAADSAADLRAENRALKQRVQELQDSVDDCLDLIGLPWGMRS